MRWHCFCNNLEVLFAFAGGRDRPSGWGNNGFALRNCWASEKSLCSSTRRRHGAAVSSLYQRYCLSQQRCPLNLLNWNHVSSQARPSNWTLQTIKGKMQKYVQFHLACSFAPCLIPSTWIIYLSRQNLLNYCYCYISVWGQDIVFFISLSARPPARLQWQLWDGEGHCTDCPESGPGTEGSICTPQVKASETIQFTIREDCDGSWFAVQTVTS